MERLDLLAQQCWRRLLEEHPPDVAHLKAELARRDMAGPNGEPVLWAPRPNFLDRRAIKDQAAAGALLISAVERIYDAIRNDIDSFEPILDSQFEAERHLLDLEGWPDNPSLEVRIDTFVSAGNVRYVELNAQMPEGGGWNDSLAEMFTELEIYNRVSESFELEPITIVDKLARAVWQRWTQWSGERRPPTVAVVAADDLPTHSDTRHLVTHLRNHGLDCFMVDPRELEFRNSRLRHQGRSIDLIYRRFMVSEVLESASDFAPILNAVRERAVCIVNPLAGSVIGRKTVFALLTDPAHEFGFSTAEREAIALHVPWTQIVADKTSVDSDGRNVELLAHIEKHRDQLVLKPAHDFGGHGVFLGWTLSDTEWSQALQVALGADYVVQQRIRTVQEEFPVLESGLPEREFFVDVDPMFHNGSFGGVISRVSGDPITNVSSGGSVVPSFVVNSRRK